MSDERPSLTDALHEGFAAWAPAAQPTPLRRRLLLGVYVVAAISLVGHGIWFVMR